jgi:hypothetical protein
MKIFKYAVISVCVIFAVSFVVTAAMIIKQSMRDIIINDNVLSLARNVNFREPAAIDMETEAGAEIIFAFTEMLGEIERFTAAASSELYAGLKKQFAYPDYAVSQHRNLKNSEMLEKIHGSLGSGMPVIFAYAASGENGAQGIYYGVAVEIDIPGGVIGVIGDGGRGAYMTYKIDEFLSATRFENYEDMALYMKLGLAADIFAKNTIFVIDPLRREHEAQAAREIK